MIRSFLSFVLAVAFLAELAGGLLLLPVPAIGALDTGSTLRNGLVGHWTFDGGDTAWASESDGSVFDVSGNGNTGDIDFMTRSSAPVPGKFGQAFSFDNTDDSINVNPDNGTLDLNSAFTISAWIKKNSLSGDDDIVAKDTNYFFQTSGDELSLYYLSPAGQGRATTDANLVTGVWYHVVVTYSDAANDIQFFVDGVQKGETTTVGDPENNTPQLNNVPANLGTDAGSPEPLDGLLDDVRIYNRVLTASEILQLSRMGASLAKPPNNLGLVGYWSFNDNSGSIATDFSGNGRHGDLFNFSGTHWVPGKRGGALDFNSIDSYINTNITANDPTTRTYAAWVYPESTGEGAFGTVLAKLNEWVFSLCNNDGTECPSTPNTIELYVNFSGTNGSWYAPANSITLNAWNHVAVTYDDSSISNDPILYINGVAVTTTEAQTPSGTAASNSNPLLIGAFDTAAQFVFDGRIDEARIYNRSLSVSEIAALYGSGAIRLAANSKTLTQGSTLTNGLVGHWTFDGGDTNWSSATAGTVTDASGNGNTGTITNMSRSAAVAIGKLGQAFLFDNTNDYIQLSDSVSLDITSELTIATWVKKNSLSGDDDLIIKGNTGLFTAQYGLETSGDEVAMYFESGGIQFQRTTDANLLTDTWYHIVLTYSDAGNAINFYVDGALKSDAAVFGSPETSSLVSGTDDLFIGEFANGEELDGSLDDLRIYNRVLTASEAKQLYSLGQATITP